MFGKKERRIQELEQQLSALTTQHQTLQQGYSQIEGFLNTHGGVEAWDAKKVLEGYEAQIAERKKDLAQVEASITKRKNAAEGEILSSVQRLKNEEETLREKLHPMRIQLKLEEAGYTDYANPAKDSIELAAELQMLRKEVQMMVRAGHAVSSTDNPQLPTTKAGLNKLAKSIAKLALIAFNSQVDTVIEKATARNYDASLAKIFKSSDTVERLCAVANVNIESLYVELRARELKLAVQHLQAKQTERELEREHKAELREQAKAERELQAERERLEKEKQHYLNVLKVVEESGNEEEVARLKEHIIEVEKGINDVEKRAANIRAGYVYVISNLGAFGERMVKIGMTRRVDPMERVKELGDASVPFNFDVHALFFSEDAVGVEAELHRRFVDKRVNRVNTRREFFYATPVEVKEELASIAGNLLEFTEEPEAEQYRLSVAEAQKEQQ